MYFTFLKFFSIFCILIKQHETVEFDLDFVESATFIDKTMLLKKFLDEKHDPFCYVTSPRGFGKTTVLKMIDKFCNIELDKNHNPKHWSQTEAYKIFNKTKIAEDKETMRHLARYAVIYLDLNFTISKPSQIDEFMVTKMFNERLHECFKRYEWLMHFYKRKYAQESGSSLNTSTNKIDVEFLEKALHVRDDDPDLKSVFKKLTDLDIEQSLTKLIEILYEHFNSSRVIVLIDNLDTTFNQLYTLANKDQVSELTFLSNTIIIVLYNGFYLVNETVLKQAFCVGISNLAINSEISDMIDDMQIYKFLDDDNNIYTPFMTFSEQDVNQLCEANNCTQNDMKIIKTYCNGYRTSVNRTFVYNPALVIEYLEQRNPKAIDILSNVTEHGNIINVFVKKSKDFKLYLATLLAGKSVTFSLWPKFNFSEFMELIQYTFENVYKKMFESILTYCYDQGFITHAKAKGHFVIPNKEMKNYIAEIKS
ncbi:uncharacterized protein LOC135840776 [Planococcus citri]|uniref:uncharacterized protein LOC135840776 n=1 Tax=Planococcus citri TaxID=170843 RepID=UPI0031F78F2C